MLKELLIYETACTDPWYNLALESHLLERVSPGQAILYLWQNRNTVVIGRNQNAWAECRVSLLAEEGGHLARRLSGGGAVFHDLGNLNFTFLMSDEDCNIPKQLSVIQAACRILGIIAVPSGRNDLLAEGAKFSGNAFYHSQGKAYHHGTLMVHVDKDKLGRYLSPPKAKLQAKGVASVRSRVVNLSELCPGLTIPAMKEAMKTAFSQVYGLPAAPLNLDSSWESLLAEKAAAMSSWDWLYGKPLPFSLECAEKYPWGHVQLLLQVESGIIRGIQIYSDAMDWTLPEILEKALTGIRFTDANIELALSSAALPEDICQDLADLLKKGIQN